MVVVLLAFGSGIVLGANWMVVEWTDLSLKLLISAIFMLAMQAAVIYYILTLLHWYYQMASKNLHHIE